MGLLAPGPISTPPDAYLSDTLDGWAPGYTYGYLLFDALASRDNAVRTEVVYEAVADPHSGDFDGAFLFDWYYRIHLIPAVLDVGNLLADQTRSVVVWNAYFSQKNVNDFALVNGGGIDVTPPAAAPYNMEPLGTYTHVVSLSTDGPAVINALMTWAIAGEPYSVPIIGRRVVVWPFAPNWRSPLDETFEWMTDVQTAFDGTELRYSLREQPRRIIEYSFNVTGTTETGLFENMVFGWADRMYAVPLWHEKSNLTSAAAAGDTSISLPTADRSYVAGGVVVLLRNTRVYEAVEIESVGDGVLTLTKALENDWPVRSRAYPSQIAMLDPTLSIQYIAEDKISGGVRFTGSPATTSPGTPDGVPPMEYNGIEVYVADTNWRGPKPTSFTSSFDVHDNDVGRLSLRQRSGWPVVTRGQEWLVKSKQEAAELKAFFGRRRGRQVPVWTSTGNADFKVVQDIVSADTSINVVDNDYGRLIAQHPARTHVMIQIRGVAAPIVRKITGYGLEEDGTANLTFDAAVGQDIPLSAIKRVSFAGLYRLASDAVTFSWQTDAVAVVQSNLALTRPIED